MKRLPLARFLRSTEITYETQPAEADQAQLFHSGRYRSGGGTYARGETVRGGTSVRTERSSAN